MTVKAVKGSIIMFLTFHIKVVLFFDILKKKSIYTKYLGLLSQKIFPRLN